MRGAASPTETPSEGTFSKLLMTASWAGFFSARNFSTVSGRSQRKTSERRRSQWRSDDVNHQKLTLQQPLELGAVHVDVLHQLYVVNVHIVLCAHSQLL